MHKMVVVINGRGGVGKDTMCEIIGKHYRVWNISSIDPIKKIAFDNGWDGKKSEKARKFLADLKQLFVEFNDLPQKYLLEKYKQFLKSDKDILFVQIREANEIAKFKDSIGGECVTLLIRGRADVKKEWNNVADDEVENYKYDFYYENNKKLEDVENDFLQFFNQMIDFTKA